MCAAKIAVDQRFADCVPAFCYGKLLRRDEVLAETLGDRFIALFIQINDMGLDPVKRKRAKVFRHWLLVILGYGCGRCWISCRIRIRGRNRCGGRRGRLFLVKYDVDHLKLLYNNTPPAIAACPVQKHIGRIACQNIFHGAWILPDPSDFRKFGPEDLRNPALDNGVCRGLQILFGWRLTGRRKRGKRPDGFYLLGRKKQQSQSGDEDPKNDQKENGPQAGNVGQQSKLSQNHQYLVGNVSLTVFVIHADKLLLGTKKRTWVISGRYSCAFIVPCSIVIRLLTD